MIGRALEVLGGCRIQFKRFLIAFPRLSLRNSATIDLSLLTFLKLESNRSQPATIGAAILSVRKFPFPELPP